MGEHAIRDYMLNCDHCENCIIEDKVHSMTFQHIRPFVFPSDGVAPEFVPDHKDKMCKVCHNKERECTCERTFQGSEVFVTAPPKVSRDRRVNVGPSCPKSRTAPNSQRTPPALPTPKSMSVPLVSQTMGYGPRWGYDFNSIPQQPLRPYQGFSTYLFEEPLFFDNNNFLTLSKDIINYY